GAMACIALLAPAVTARAEEAPRPLEIGVGALYGAVFGDACVRDGDVGLCPGGMGFAGAQLAPRWRFARALSVGAYGTAAFGSGAYPQTWWSAAGEARVHPFELGSADIAFGLDVGLVAVVDHLRADVPNAARSLTTLAPALGGLFGVDFGVSPAFALGF